MTVGFVLPNHAEVAGNDEVVVAVETAAEAVFDQVDSFVRESEVVIVKSMCVANYKNGDNNNLHLTVCGKSYKRGQDYSYPLFTIFGFGTPASTGMSWPDGSVS